MTQSPSKDMTERKVWGVVLILCLGSRLMSAVYYIEDLDSLRFALAVVDYDVARLQPHFPAYPVFCFFAKALYALTDRYAVAFAVLGGAAVFGTIYFALGLAQLKITTPWGLSTAFLLFFNPLLWLMSNRYMPDALGVAGVLACCHFVARPEASRAGVGFFMAGLSLGVRLSYAPLLLAPLLLRVKAGGPRLLFGAAGVAGVGVWLIPTIALTGWAELVQAAHAQTQGHFADFGGTVATEPDFARRSIRLFESVWADGFGLYWPGRHGVTACTTVALLGVLAASGRAVVQQARGSVVLSPPVIGCIVYLGWIFLFQNVIHKSRHVLPLVPFLALIPALASAQLATRGPWFFRLVASAFFCCYGYVTLHLVAQHKQPTAIAQLHQYLAAKESAALHVAAVPLIKYYLASQALQAVYIPIGDRGDMHALAALADKAELVVIGSPLPGRVPRASQTFYHNPYVNRLWPELALYEY